MNPNKPSKVKTLKQAFEFILQTKVCLIFGSKTSGLPSLWDVVDLPARMPGQKVWGQKSETIWTWKNEPPVGFPDEIFFTEQYPGF